MVTWTQCTGIWISPISVNAKAAHKNPNQAPQRPKISQRLIIPRNLTAWWLCITRTHSVEFQMQVQMAWPIKSLWTKMMKDQQINWTIKQMKFWINQIFKMMLIKSQMINSSNSQSLQPKTLWEEPYSNRMAKSKRRVILQRLMRKREPQTRICLTKMISLRILLEIKTGRGRIQSTL